MGSFAIIPAAPILLDGVDLAEHERIAELRAAIEFNLMSQTVWALPVRELPPLAGLGGWGIDRGVDTRTNEVLEGDQWVQAVSELSPAGRTSCESAHPAIAVALLHAHAAGVHVGPLGTSDDLLIPIDLSVAASAEAPLAPASGASNVDGLIVSSLEAGDAKAVAAAIESAPDVHADLELLDAGMAHMLELETSDYAYCTVFDENVHEVRSLCGIATL